MEIKAGSPNGNMVPVIETASLKVMCANGHPAVYLHIENNRQVKCSYCNRIFVYVGEDSHEVPNA